MATTQGYAPGCVDYALACAWQAAAVAKKISALDEGGCFTDCLFLLEHPHVFTLGRHANRDNLLASEDLVRQRGAAIFQSDRGGDITYHGPGQLVAYPVLTLRNPVAVGEYVSQLEQCMLRTLESFGISAEPREGFPGVFVGRDKIGAIGIHVGRGVTSHGLALNVNPDLSFFEMIVPCGLKDFGVTSMQRLLGSAPPSGAVQRVFELHFSDIFETAIEWQSTPPDFEKPDMAADTPRETAC